MADLALLTAAVMKGDRTNAVAITKEALAAQQPVRQILDATVAAMDEVGRKFQCSELFIPDMLIASRAMKEVMAQLEPHLVKAGIHPELTAVIGTVKGDQHDIGKNLVAMMWRGANFAVVDLGTCVPPEKFVNAAREHKAKVVGLSALLTTTMPAMKETVAALKSADLPGVRVVVGGAPVTEEFARQIGADGFSADAAGAVELVRKLMVA